MAQTPGTIIYTKVDEAPQLASASLLPIIESFLGKASLNVETRDISLAGRVIATFPENLTAEQRIADDLAGLGELVKTADANVIKLPNVSASVPQLEACIKELQSQGYDIPDYPEDPQTDAEKDARARYDAIKGSAVNPVLREGNSDRRAPAAVKAFAQANPHSMGEWSAESKTRVATMGANDFRSNETSVTLSAAQAAGTAKIVHTAADGTQTVLKDGLSFPEGTIVDATFMSVKALKAFYDAQIASVAEEGTLFSLHMKATMMKVSDPIIFGHCVRQYLAPVFDQYGADFDAAGVSPNGGLGAMLDKIAEMSNGAEIKAAIDACLASRPPMYMVNSDKGITNLHVPSDVIIDASMPAVIRAGGKGWGPDGNEGDTTCVIPDSSYAGVYAETIDYFKETGKLDVTTAGTVQNVGLMAQKAEEYGSHPTTFELAAGGTVEMIAGNGDVLHSHSVEAGDIWRLASARKDPILNWIELAIERQAAEDCRAIFWLDADRAHDAELIKYVTPVLEARGLSDKFEIMAPTPATRASCETIREGKTCIAITGNVLRDYLTDLFPILEVGTSAKMLSVVKLMQGGGLFETGAGGSAPKHVQQLVEQNHLRWDSLGEFCALGESLRFAGTPAAKLMGKAVDDATEKLLSEGKSPGRKVGQDDNRTSHYYFARYWAEAMAAQTDDADLAAAFAPIAQALASGEDAIVSELKAGGGTAVDLGGYYHTDPAKAAAVMRPSATLNAIIG
ncbi:NADP-dependent isocitrate dehydrogenase [Thalassobacter stenotrophicus]|uniref:isocitrate dehydrogenase (NADP(+)) n=2 Tax=Thalassobacter stenotrophicus TaxID=266809 RepID=A0A0P1F2R6_9RHOB|nr:NADP-dependent isocitrate dehydrogenase [Thalassobacter stenotrophicus]PVZ49055.1 NADP-dependent isocitrate dehydrogenase [Thalassobacter stenotrophicus]CUH61958.1 Isocitrate dehydrogenase [NADP] [Thalassobacter stenotrophicus]SHI38148.1 isocitrate dehydrogenase [Thalassobacter stenotrophicus DSM 16310]